MNDKLEAAFKRLAHPNQPTQYDIELMKAVAMIVQADAIERIAIAAEVRNSNEESGGGPEQGEQKDNGSTGSGCLAGC